MFEMVCDERHGRLDQGGEYFASAGCGVEDGSHVHFGVVTIWSATAANNSYLLAK
jgi:hypothetical protein